MQVLTVNISFSTGSFPNTGVWRTLRGLSQIGVVEKNEGRGVGHRSGNYLKNIILDAA